MPYLAMTAAEFHGCRKLPEKTAWMACHFSPYGTGLTNLPVTLQERTLLILNDRTPIHGHDPQRVRDQLAQTIDALKCEALLLDFQRHSEETHGIIKELLRLPCPVIVSQLYAEALDCPVFLSPVPLLKTIEEHIAPWHGRQIWLEAALNGTVITVTKEGSTFTSLPVGEIPQYPFEEGELHCHYSISVSEKQAKFTLYRTKNDLHKLLEEGKNLGIKNTVGLYQELQ